jgi:hypothetical protein
MSEGCGVALLVRVHGLVRSLKHLCGFRAVVGEDGDAHSCREHDVVATDENGCFMAWRIFAATCSALVRWGMLGRSRRKLVSAHAGYGVDALHRADQAQ